MFLLDRFLLLCFFEVQTATHIIDALTNTRLEYLCSHPTNVSSVRLYTLPYALQMGLVHGSFNQPLLYMHANMHCTDSSQVGGVVVGLGLILGHMTKCTNMQGICTIMCIVCTCIVYA